MDNEDYFLENPNQMIRAYGKMHKEAKFEKLEDECMYFYYIIAAAVIAVDQFTKLIIVKNMEQFEQIPVIEDFFYITSHRNKGAAWGILQDQMILFYIITVIVVIGIVYYMQKHAKGNMLLALGLSFVLGGAIGNFIDPLFRQEGVDFLDFIIFTYDFPIFNVADSALVVGVGFIILATLLEETKKGKK